MVKVSSKLHGLYGDALFGGPVEEAIIRHTEVFTYVSKCLPFTDVRIPKKAFKAAIVS